MCGKPLSLGFRTAAHSDIVCRADLGARTRHFGRPPTAVGNHMFADRPASIDLNCRKTLRRRPTMNESAEVVRPDILEGEIPARPGAV